MYTTIHTQYITLIICISNTDVIHILESSLSAMFEQYFTLTIITCILTIFLTCNWLYNKYVIYSNNKYQYNMIVERINELNSCVSTLQQHYYSLQNHNGMSNLYTLCLYMCGSCIIARVITKHVCV